MELMGLEGKVPPPPPSFSSHGKEVSMLRDSRAPAFCPHDGGGTQGDFIKAPITV